MTFVDAIFIIPFLSIPLILRFTFYHTKHIAYSTLLVSAKYYSRICHDILGSGISQLSYRIIKIRGCSHPLPTLSLVLDRAPYSGKGANVNKQAEIFVLCVSARTERVLNLGKTIGVYHPFPASLRVRGERSRSRGWNNFFGEFEEKDRRKI